ncbi:MAG: DUF4154 domain-containing protein [Bacteroidales bacterium]|nr:DUF4154 domain-containing protein [Bacteroidales bacterium]
MNIAKYCTFIVFLFIQLQNYAKVEQVDYAQIKVSMVYNICDYIKWPQEEKLQNFTIGISGNDPDIISAFNSLAKSKKLKSKTILIKKISDFNNSGDVQVIFCSKTSESEIASLSKYCIANSILLITDEFSDILFSDINFKINKNNNKIYFEINKNNLSNSQLSYKNELLIYGGNIVDMKELYSSVNNKLNEELQKSKRLFEENEKQTVLLEKKNSKIDSLTKGIKKNQLILQVLTDSTHGLHEKIKSKELYLKKFDLYIEKTKIEIENLTKQQNDLLIFIKKKENNIFSLDEKIAEREKTIEDQANFLNSKDQIIKSKNDTVQMLIIAGIVFVFVGLFLLYAFITKAKYNSLLEVKIDERTQELQNEIIKRENSEIALSKSERNYREIFNAVSDVIFIQDLDGEIIDANIAIEKIYGYQKDEVKNLTLADFSSSKIAFRNKELNEKLLIAKDLGVVSFDWETKRKNGEFFGSKLFLNIQTSVVLIEL